MFQVKVARGMIGYLDGYVGEAHECRDYARSQALAGHRVLVTRCTLRCLGIVVTLSSKTKKFPIGERSDAFKYCDRYNGNISFAWEGA